MLSKNQRKMLNEILDIALLCINDNEKLNELIKEKKELKGKKLLEKIETKTKFKVSWDKLQNYLSDYLSKYKNPKEYKRVLKHRLIKTTNQLIDDLILIHKAYGILGLFDNEFRFNKLINREKYENLVINLPDDVLSYLNVNVFKK